MKKRTKKALCLVLSLALLLSSATGITLNQDTEAAAKLILNVAAKGTPEDTHTEQVKDADAQRALLAEKIYELCFSEGEYIPDIMDTDSIYSAYALAASGFQAEDFYLAIADKVTAQLQDLQTNGTTTSTSSAITLDYYEGNPYTEINYTKLALFLNTVDRDITDVGGMNLIDKITDRALYDVSNPTTLSRDSMILFVMNAYRAKHPKAVWPEGENRLTEQELIDNILADVDNQIEISKEWDSYDSAAMVIQALAPYALSPETNQITQATQAEILKARDKVLSLLSDIQDSDSGAYLYMGESSPWTLAQVMITLGLYQIDVLEDEHYIKNGKTLFDVSASFINLQEETVDENLMGFQPDQLLRGLNAAIDASAWASPDDTAPSASPGLSTNTPPNAAASVSPGLSTNTPPNAAASASPAPTNSASTAPSTSPSVSPSTVPSTAPSAKPSSDTSSKKISLAKPTIKKAASPKKKTLTVTFSKVKNAKKYKIQIALDKKFKKKVQTKTVSSVKKITFRKLKSHHKYYVRIQAINGKQKSKWSKTVSKKIK